MAVAQVDMATRLGWRESVVFAKKRQFAWKTVVLAVVSLGLGLVVLSRNAFAAQLYLGLLVVVHVAGLAVFAAGTRREDIAPSRFGLFWRLTGLLVMVALLMMIRLNAASPWFWPTLGTIWAVHTAGLSLLHLRGAPGAACPFLPRAWQRA